MAFGASVLLSERLTRWRIWGLIFGFAGVVVLVWPELSAPSQEGTRLIGYAIGLVAATLTALALLMVRSLNRTESPGAIALYFVLASMIGGVLTLPWGWIVPDLPTLGFLILSGLFGGFGHIAMTLAFRYAEASRLAPFEYVALIWPVLADVFIFEIGLAPAFLLGAPLIMIGALIASTEKRDQLSEPAAPRNTDSG